MSMRVAATAGDGMPAGGSSMGGAGSAGAGVGSAAGGSSAAEGMKLTGPIGAPFGRGPRIEISSSDPITSFSRRASANAWSFSLCSLSTSIAWS